MILIMLNLHDDNHAHCCEAQYSWFAAISIEFSEEYRARGRTSLARTRPHEPKNGQYPGGESLNSQIRQASARAPFQRTGLSDRAVAMGVLCADVPHADVVPIPH